MANKLDAYINEIKNTMNSLLEADGVGVGDMPPAGMEDPSMSGMAATQEDPLGGMGASVPSGDPLMSGGEGTMSPEGVEGEGEELSKEDEQLLNKLEGAYSEEEGEEEEKGKEKTGEPPLGSAVEIYENKKEKVSKKDGVFEPIKKKGINNSVKNGTKNNSEEPVVTKAEGKKTKKKIEMTSDIKHVPKGVVAKNQVHQDWEALIDRILRIIRAVSVETTNSLQKNEEDIDTLKEHVKKLESILYESLVGVRETIKDLSFYIARGDATVSIAMNESISRERRFALINKLQQSRNVSDVREVLKESSEIYSGGSSRTERLVSPLRLSSAEVDKIQEFKRKTAEKQDGTLLGEGKGSLPEQRDPQLPFSVSRLQEMAGIVKEDEYL